mmetsp:Transcript_8233/g.27968  ORF Transcript_8233/g.27968 Transcript_8233/m.27968 type:complete len:432 (-) Transcript_8233:699-1994(-)
MVWGAEAVARHRAGTASGWRGSAQSLRPGPRRGGMRMPWALGRARRPPAAARSRPVSARSRRSVPGEGHGHSGLLDVEQGARGALHGDAKDDASRHVHAEAEARGHAEAQSAGDGGLVLEGEEEEVLGARPLHRGDAHGEHDARERREGHLPHDGRKRNHKGRHADGAGHGGEHAAPSGLEVEHRLRDEAAAAEAAEGRGGEVAARVGDAGAVRVGDGGLVRPQGLHFCLVHHARGEERLEGGDDGDGDGGEGNDLEHGEGEGGHGRELGEHREAAREGVAARGHCERLERQCERLAQDGGGGGGHEGRGHLLGHAREELYHRGGEGGDGEGRHGRRGLGEHLELRLDEEQAQAVEEARHDRRGDEVHQLAELEEAKGALHDGGHGDHGHHDARAVRGDELAEGHGDDRRGARDNARAHAEERGDEAHDHR